MKDDKLVKATCLIALILTAIHFRQYLYSNNQIGPFVRLIFCALYPFGAIKFGRKFIYQFFIVFAYALSWINTFNNYTSFMVILLASYFFPEKKKLLLSIYSINCVTSFIVNGYQISHVAIHGLNCFCIYYAFYMLKDTFGIKPLKLTKPEVKILKELCEGKTPKEVTCYSTNTVYKRIQEMKERNNCISTSELLFRFKITESFYEY